MIYLYGASGHGKVVAEIAQVNKIAIAGFIDDDLQKNSYFNYPVYHELPKDIEDNEFIISIGNNAIRSRLAKNFTKCKFGLLKHPQTNISSSTNIGKGSVIMAGVSVNVQAKIGQHSIINTNASIDHDCVLGDFVHISPNVGLAGNVIVGEGTHIGIGASVIQGIKIGRWCTIGAGSVIIRDVSDGSTVVGNPGRIINRIRH